MSFPASLTVRTVKGRFVTVNDRGIAVPAQGSARIILEDFMQGPTDDAFVTPFDHIFKFDSTGKVSVDLPSNNDPQWTPGVYRIVLTVGMKVHRQKFDVPYNETGPLDLADILNLPTVTPGQSYILLASKGVAGGVASLDVSGKLPVSQLPDGLDGDISWDDVDDKPSTFPPSSHVHDFASITSKPSTYPPSDHAHVPEDVGLGNVDDTSDLAKPLSIAASLALSGFIAPSDHGFCGWTFPPDMVAEEGTILPTAGLSYVVRLRVLKTTVSAINVHVHTPGVDLTNCFASLHNDAGAILGLGAVTQDQSSAWESVGFKSMSLVTQQGSLTPGGFYKIRWWVGSATTMPTLSRAGNVDPSMINAGLSAPNFRYATADSDLTTAELAPQNIGTMTGGPTAWWVSVTE